ncbi:hypothetical protein QZH41_007386 [Actinostola sp. cb2023]|nr:hypothetical protein QZH41_007386 [Actinostola sp. cb2023]
MDNLSNLTTAFQNTTSIQAGILSETKLVLYSVLLVFSLLGNILVIAVVFYNENLRSDFNYLIVNMAISDLFIPLLAIPQRISEVSGLLRHNEWLIGGVGGAFLCKLSYFLSDIAPAVSIFSLVIIAASRFVAIVYPFNVGLANALNKKNRILIALTWLTATALFGSYFYFVHLIPDQRGYWQCKLSFDSPKYFVIFYSFIIIGTYFVPFTIIAILYSIMVFKLYKRTRDIEEHFDDRQVRSRQRRNKKIFFLSIVIVLACFLFLGPIFVSCLW